MKKLITIAGLAIGLVLFAAPPPNNVTLFFSWLPDNTQMAGLSTNDYTSNITAVAYSTKNVNIPTNNWPVIAALPLSSFLSQGPVGSTWAWPTVSDGNSRFYALVMTNNNGGASPFSNLAPGLISPTTGTLLMPKVGP